ncbi:TIGR03066 family protein [Gemmata sp.]|uniref:TIGR03066 family protein n=1 Tax=Gemmata sp. TaxID=1914242 RepID=UPI003F6FC8F7
MRALVAAVVVLSFAGFTTADDKKDGKIDAKKLIGKWSPTDEKAPVVVEFTDKGKMSLTIEVGGKSEKIEGTYKLDGDKLEMVMAFGGKEMKETVTISKLTDEEMVGKDSKGKEEKFKKLK